MMFRSRPIKSVNALISNFSTSSQFYSSTKRMNLFSAVNDAMRIALRTDESAIVFGEDDKFGGLKSVVVKIIPLCYTNEY